MPRRGNRDMRGDFPPRRSSASICGRRRAGRSEPSARGGAFTYFSRLRKKLGSTTLEFTLARLDVGSKLPSKSQKMARNLLVGDFLGLGPAGEAVEMASDDSDGPNGI